MEKIWSLLRESLVRWVLDNVVWNCINAISAVISGIAGAWYRGALVKVQHVASSHIGSLQDAIVSYPAPIVIGAASAIGVLLALIARAIWGIGTLFLGTFLRGSRNARQKQSASSTALTPKAATAPRYPPRRMETGTADKLTSAAPTRTVGDPRRALIQLAVEVGNFLNDRKTESLAISPSAVQAFMAGPTLFDKFTILLYNERYAERARTIHALLEDPSAPRNGTLAQIIEKGPRNLGAIKASLKYLGDLSGEPLVVNDL